MGSRYGIVILFCTFTGIFFRGQQLDNDSKGYLGEKSKTDHGPGNSQEGSSTMILNFPAFDRYLLKAFHSLPATSPGP